MAENRQRLKDHLLLVGHRTAALLTLSGVLVLAAAIAGRWVPWVADTLTDWEGSIGLASNILGVSGGLGAALGTAVLLARREEGNRIDGALREQGRLEVRLAHLVQEHQVLQRKAGVSERRLAITRRRALEAFSAFRTRLDEASREVPFSTMREVVSRVERGDYDGAIELLAAAGWPPAREAEARYFLARLLDELGRYDDALREIEQAQILAPNGRYEAERERLLLRRSAEKNAEWLQRILDRQVQSSDDPEADAMLLLDAAAVARGNFREYGPSLLSLYERAFQLGLERLSPQSPLTRMVVENYFAALEKLAPDRVRLNDKLGLALPLARRLFVDAPATIVVLERVAADAALAANDFDGAHAALSRIATLLHRVDRVEVLREALEATRRYLVRAPALTTSLRRWRIEGCDHNLAALSDLPEAGAPPELGGAISKSIQHLLSADPILQQSRQNVNKLEQILHNLLPSDSAVEFLSKFEVDQKAKPISDLIVDLQEMMPGLQKNLTELPKSELEIRAQRIRHILSSFGAPQDQALATAIDDFSNMLDRIDHISKTT